MNTSLLKKLGLAAMMLLGIGTAADAAISSTPVTGSTDAAKKLYKFMYDNYGKKTISGVQTGDMDGASELAKQKDVAEMFEISGKTPALVGLDLLMHTGAKQDNSWYQSYTETCVMLAKELWLKGGIPAFTWHWKDPSRETESHGTDAKFDFTKAFVAGTTTWDESSDEYKTMIKDIDRVSEVFLGLQDLGVACIWRPLHEASGAWFWWGTGNAEQYKALYKLMYNRMVKVNGVKNCLWVWNIEKLNISPYNQEVLEPSWYPGDEYCDFISVDVYKNANDNGSLIDYYNKIQSLMGTDKMIALSENGPIPDVDNMHKDGAVWSWWMPWYGSWGETDFIKQTPTNVMKSNMNDDRIITLDEMEDWGTYTGVIIESDCSKLNSALRQEAECGDYKGLEVGNDSYSGGKAINVDGNDGYINFVFNAPSAGLYKLIIADAAAYGAKHYAVSVNGAEGVDVAGLEAYGEVNAGSFKFNAGENTVKIMPGWTWFAIDYVRIEADQEASKAVEPSATLCDAKATDAAKELYSFLLKNWGKKTVSGFMTGDMGSASKGIKGHEDVAAVYNASGKYPALVGFDLLNATGSHVDAGDSWYLGYTKSAISLAKELWSLGGIPAFTWHWYDPSRSKDAFYVYNPESTEEKFQKGTEFDFTSAMDASGNWDESSEVYKNMIKDIDIVADYFLDLQKEGIAATWRPLHEASGAWFWWGIAGAENYGKLYRLIYNEMVNVKGVHNLIWVWNPCSVSDADWNPGNDYYDVISIDIYNKPNDHQSNYTAFNTLKNVSNFSKLIALSENGPIPDVNECADNESLWSWWMPWYQTWGGEFANQTSNAVWKSNMDDERVITLEDMPGWTKSGVKNMAADAANVYPTKVGNYFIVEAENAQVIVINTLGQNVVTKSVNGSAMVPTTNWSNGMYVVKVVSDKGEKTYKLIK